jgi:uncharacterized protein YcfJ
LFIKRPILFIGRSGRIPQLRATMRDGSKRTASALCNSVQNREFIVMRIRTAALTALSTAVLLAGCATQPMGPSIPVMPAQGKSMDQFQADENYCEDYASGRSNGKVKEANDQELKNGIVGAALGAGIGALAGNTKGALIGGGIGAVLGGSSGAGYDQHRVQRTYDIAYAQCMTARGDDVGGPRRRRMRRYAPPPPPPGDYPGDYPPPPPPGR